MGRRGGGVLQNDTGRGGSGQEMGRPGKANLAFATMQRLSQPTQAASAPRPGMFEVIRLG
jgi:hypothetical protein